jgi:hypothetical protein
MKSLDLMVEGDAKQILETENIHQKIILRHQTANHNIDGVYQVSIYDSFSNTLVTDFTIDESAAFEWQTEFYEYTYLPSELQPYVQYDVILEYYPLGLEDIAIEMQRTRYQTNWFVEMDVPCLSHYLCAYIEGQDEAQANMFHIYQNNDGLINPETEEPYVITLVAKAYQYEYRVVLEPNQTVVVLPEEVMLQTDYLVLELDAIDEMYPSGDTPLELDILELD